PLLMGLAELLGGRELSPELTVLLGPPGELGVAAGQLIAVGLLGVIARPAELHELRAGEVALGPELIDLVSACPLAPGQRRPERFGFVGGGLPVDARTSLFGSGHLESLIALPEQLGESPYLGAGGVKLGLLLPRPFLGRTDACGVLIAKGRDLAPEPFDL